MERMHHALNEIESENKCNHLLITKLEDELIMLRKCEARNVIAALSTYRNMRVIYF